MGFYEDKAGSPGETSPSSSAYLGTCHRHSLCCVYERRFFLYSTLLMDTPFLLFEFIKRRSVASVGCFKWETVRLSREI